MLTPEMRGEIKSVHGRVTNGEIISCMPVCYLKKNRVMIDLKVSATPLYDLNGKMIGTPAVIREDDKT